MNLGASDNLTSITTFSLQLNARRRAFRGEVVGLRRGEVVGLRRGGVRDDVQGGSNEAAGDNLDGQGTLKLDLSSLDQMRDLKPKKKGSGDALPRLVMPVDLLSFSSHLQPCCDAR